MAWGLNVWKYTFSHMIFLVLWDNQKRVLPSTEQRADALTNKSFSEPEGEKTLTVYYLYHSDILNLDAFFFHPSFGYWRKKKDILLTSKLGAEQWASCGSQMLFSSTVHPISLSSMGGRKDQTWSVSVLSPARRTGSFIYKVCFVVWFYMT